MNGRIDAEYVAFCCLDDYECIAFSLAFSKEVFDAEAVEAGAVESSPGSVEVEIA